MNIVFHIILFIVGFIPPGAATAQDARREQSGPVPGIVTTDGTYFGDTVLSSLDSLDLKLLEIEIANAELEVRKTDFWHRLIPKLHFSATFSLNNILFIDPDTFWPSLLPNDAYRVSVSFSVNDIFDFDKNTSAELVLDKLRVNYERLRQQQRLEHSILIVQLHELDSLFVEAGEELEEKDEILKYKTLCFGQGRITFDEFLGSKLDLMNVRKSLMRLRHQRAAIWLKLHGGYQQ